MSEKRKKDSNEVGGFLQTVERVGNALPHPAMIFVFMAPIFVPMLDGMNIHPALIQVAYRIGDSTTNIISPLMSYFAMIVVFMQKYDKEKGLGTLISTMLPYSLTFLIGWSIFMVIWMLLGIPVGPGAPLYIN